MKQTQTFWLGLAFSALLMLLAACAAKTTQTVTILPTVQPTSMPTPDRLAEPILPENPTQYDEGKHLYWLNCMPCHGDRGQGLTDEFRALWVSDHQNCWARGCHAGREEDQGFPLPRTIPAIISANGDALTYKTADKLFEYLRITHPPQHPGYLPENEYWAIAAYVLTENDLLPAGQEIGPISK